MRTLRKLDGSYWITSDDPRDLAAGPYDSKKEAEADRVGLNRFDREFAKQFPALSALHEIITSDEPEDSPLVEGRLF